MIRVPRLHTQRLLLRGWRAADLAPFAAMCADPEVMRWIGDGRTHSLAESAATLSAIRSSWETQGYGLFAVEHRESGEFCGFCGLAAPTGLLAVMPSVAIDWRLCRRFGGQGFAREAAQRISAFAFEELGLERLVAICQSPDLDSQRVAAHLGMELWLAATDPNCQRRVRVFALSRAEWLAQAPGVHPAHEEREYFFEEGCYILELLNDPDHPQTSIARARVPPGTTTRWHHLQGITEHYVVVEGIGRVELGSEPPREVRPGDVVRIPPGVRQRITSIGQGDLLFLAVCAPRFRQDSYHAQ
jgi:RimJ/RimL family protein N-acetyltransferase/mannose-6-phosphate isomerase-like protein (cupin superfamily)